MSLATQAPPFAQGGLHTTVKRQHRYLHLQCMNIDFDAYSTNIGTSVNAMVYSRNF